MFLSNYRFKVYSDNDVNSFIDQLHHRWVQQQGQPPTQARDHIVFISFASDDFELVRILYRIFREYNIDTWFDRVELDHGADIKPELKANIDKACVFVPVITQHSLIKRNEGHFLLEWDYAIRRFNQQQEMQSDQDLRFHPIVIDLDGDIPVAQGAFGEVKNEFWARRQLILKEYTLRNTDDFSNDNQIDRYMTSIRDIQRKRRKP